jgi:ABC-type xylose transport system permease subunit
MLPSVTLLGPLDAVLGDWMEYVLLVLVVANLVTRGIAHRSHVRQAAQNGADAVTRHPAHVASNVLLILASFYYTTLHQHSGVVISMLVVAMFLSDFFEFEARKVEARRDVDLERPKSAIAASVLVLLYAAYISLFFIIEPIWSGVI